MNANAYAALKELNHYAASNTRFRACYDPQHLVDIDEQRPPFDYVYVVSNQTATDYKILDKNKLCNVIAHKIFLDFGDELTTIIQGQKNNFLEKLARMDEHPRRNVQQYLTFGLAKLYFPNERTVQVTLTRIKQNLVSFWLKGEGQSPDPQVMLDRFLLNWEPNRKGNMPFVNQLEILSQEKNKTFSQALKNWNNQIEENIHAIQNSGDRQRLLEQLPSDIRAQFHKVQPGETDNTRGGWLTRIQQATPKLTQTLKQDIELFLAELLQPSAADFCIENARDWLEALLTHFNKWRRELEDLLQSFDGLHSRDDLEQKWRNTAQRLQDIEQQRNFLGLQEKKKTQQFQEEIQQSLQDISKFIRQNFDYILHQEALQIIKALQTSVQTLIAQGTQFNSLLKSVNSGYEKRGGDLIRLNEDDITGEALFVEEDMRECYEFFLPEREYHATLIEVSKQILEVISADSSLATVLTQKRFINDQELRNSIDAAFNKRFSIQSNDIKQSVLQRFLHKYPSMDAERRLKQILREAEPLLPLNLSDHYFYNDKGNKSEIIAFKQNDDRNTQQFRDILTRKLGIEESILKSIQSDSEVFIVNEYAAFPLRLIANIKQMREQYDRQCRHDMFLFHNDYNQIFSEIIPPDNIGEIQDNFYACIVFDILKDESQYYTYDFIDKYNRPHRFEFSITWTEAIEQLSTNDSLAQNLKNEYEKIIEDIRHNPDQWQNEYLPKILVFIEHVRKLSETDPNYLERFTVVGEEADSKKSAKQGILDRILDRLSSESSKAIEIQSITQQYQKTFDTIDSRSENDTSQSKVTPRLLEDKNEPLKNIVQELKELADLHEKGVLSNSEFELFKRKLSSQ